MFSEFNKPIALSISLLLYVALVPFVFMITMRWTDVHFPVEYYLIILFSDWLLTSLVYVLSLIIGNCSLIDFYWTIWPLLQLYYTMSLKSLTHQIFGSYKLILACCVFTLWGVRLTYNYIRSWPGFTFVDFRIKELLEILPSNKIVVWTVLYFEYFIFPGLFLYFAKLPILSFALYCDPSKFSLYHVFGLLTMIFAISYQTLADKQLFLHRIGPDNHKILDSGVWKFSRHPNYFGEMSFWWGVFILSHEIYFDSWDTLFYMTGAIVMSVLFHFMTGPWMDRHMARKRPEYREYMKRNRSIVIPWFRSEEQKQE